jgi:hypothetical protein
MQYLGLEQRLEDLAVEQLVSKLLFGDRRRDSRVGRPATSTSS